jgi:hypothetical protein
VAKLALSHTDSARIVTLPSGAISDAEKLGYGDWIVQNGQEEPFW